MQYCACRNLEVGINVRAFCVCIFESQMVEIGLSGLHQPRGNVNSLFAEAGIHLFINTRNTNSELFK